MKKILCLLFALVVICNTATAQEPEWIELYANDECVYYVQEGSKQLALSPNQTKTVQLLASPALKKDHDRQIQEIRLNYAQKTYCITKTTTYRSSPQQGKAKVLRYYSDELDTLINDALYNSGIKYRKTQLRLERTLLYRKQRDLEQFSRDWDENFYLSNGVTVVYPDAIIEHTVFGGVRQKAHDLNREKSIIYEKLFIFCAPVQSN